MDEIIENIRQRAKGLYEAKMDILQLRRTTIAKLQNEIRDISKEQKMIGDKSDDFYQYLETQKSAKKEEFSRLVEDCLKKSQRLEKSFPIEKEIIINYLNNLNYLNDSKTPEDTRFRINEMINDITENFTVENIENFYRTGTSEIAEKKETETIEDTTVAKDAETVAETVAEAVDTTVKQKSEPIAEVKDTSIEQESEPVAEVKDTSIEQESEPVAKVEDTAVEQKSEPVAEVKDTSVEQESEPVAKVEDTAVEQESKLTREDIDRILFTPPINSMGNIKTTSLNIEGVNILYKASTNQYIAENPYTKGQKIINRDELKKLDKALVSEKTDRSIDDLKYVHTDILQVLRQYDKENATNTSTKYFKIARIGKAKEARKEEFKEAKINIHYDLTGLYDSNVEGKDELLEMANLAKKAGIATVKKGIKVTIRESLDKLGSRFESLLPFSNNEQIKYLEAARQETKVEDSKYETELTAKQKVATPVNTEPHKQEIDTPVMSKDQLSETKMAAELDVRKEALEQAHATVDSVEPHELETEVSVVSKEKDQLAESKMTSESDVREETLGQAHATVNPVEPHEQETEVSKEKDQLAESKMTAEVYIRQKALEQARANYDRLQKDLRDLQDAMPCSHNRHLAVQWIQYEKESNASKGTDVQKETDLDR